MGGRLLALVAGCVLAGNAISAQQAAIEKRMGPSIAAMVGAPNLKSTSASSLPLKKSSLCGDVPPN